MSIILAFAVGALVGHYFPQIYDYVHSVIAAYRK